MPVTDPILILLVEDNPSDVRLFEVVFGSAKIFNRLEVVRDGVQALDYLRAIERGETECPHLIILDLNLPKIDGREVLAEIKSDSVLRTIPVVVFTVSSDQADIQACYGNDVSAYFIKPVGLPDLFETIHKIEEYWLAVEHPPPCAETTPS